tara:strand:- start:7707 stop:8462 length:756 start_codon:yes stop_codon:yes gene_type:complete
MSTKQPPRVQFDFVVDEVNEETGEVNPNFIYGDDGGPSIDMGVEDSELDLPSIEKEEIVENTIFDIPKESVESVKTVQNEIPFIAPPQGKRKGINKNGKPRKPMSEEHKKKLALAREKARVAKQVKMKERQENRDLEKQEKELLKKQKVNRVKKLKEEVDVSEGNPPPQRPAPTPPQKSLTIEDIQQAQMDAIMAYENVRKARKEEKKKAQLIEAQKMEMRRKIAQAQPQSYSYGAKDTNGRLVNRYDNCY